MFTGIAKELFEKYLENFFEQNGYLLEQCVYTDDIEQWKKLPLSMQIGVIEDFAESLGYLIDGINYGNRIDIKIYKKDMSIIQVLRVKTKQEARQELIKQLNKLINERTHKSNI